MNQPIPKKRSKRTLLIILSAIFLLLCGGGIYLYSNFNKLLSNALLESFNKNVISDVYELKFESLHVDPFKGNIKVKNVSLEPRKQSLNPYPYINSSFTLKTRSLKLLNVQLMTLIKDNNLVLERIEIDKPEVDLKLDGKVNLFFPLNDTSGVQEQTTKKKFVEHYELKEFRLMHAAFSAIDSDNGSKFTIKDFNILLSDIMISQQPGHEEYYYRNFILNVGESTGGIKEGPFRSVFFKDLHVQVDSFNVDKTMDTLIYGFKNCKLAIHALDLHTGDSLTNIQMNAFDLSYKDHSIVAQGISLKPNKSFVELQKDYKYQKTDVSFSVDTLKLAGIDYDGFLKKRFFVGSLSMDNVEATIYKDNTKMIDDEHLPGYPGQQIAKIPLPLRIDSLKLSNAHIQSVERKKDGELAIVNLTKGIVNAYNVTNQQPEAELKVNAEALLAEKVKFEMKLDFSYAKPQITYRGHLSRFNLPDLNKVLAAYTPAKIDSGIADDISFSGVVTHTQSSGTMKFLYHGLIVDLNIKDKAKWKSAVVAFAANEYLSENNPPGPDLPVKVVKYDVQRDMHKGFVNILIKSAIAGVKETMLLSGENKKAYKAKKKAMKEKEK